ncbi:MAG: hypothetical protein ACR2JM_02565 [Mycobacterium sp.]
MLLRFLFITAVAGVAGVAGTASAGADPAPPPPPPIPNVNAYMPMNPADYAANGGKWYAVAGPAGVVCILDNLNGDYGCSGPLPGAPDGANLVSAGPVGAPTFATTPEPIFAAAGAVKPLPPNTRLSYRQVSCGVDAAGVVACFNSRDQVGFVVGPEGTYINAVNPLLDRPQGTNPGLPGLPPVMPAMPPG